MFGKNTTSTMIVSKSAISATKSSGNKGTKIFCTICQDSILSTENEEVNEFDLIRCSEKSNHIFHTKCFVDWFEIQKRCPLCSICSLEAVSDFCEKAFSYIPHYKNPTSNFYALKMICGEGENCCSVLAEYISKTRSYDENVNLLRKIHQFHATAFLDRPNLMLMLKEAIRYEKFLKMPKRELYETLISDKVQKNFISLLLPINVDFYSILTIDEIIILLERFIFKNFYEMKGLGRRFLNSAGDMIEKVGKFFNHKNFCKIILKSIEYRCEISLIDSNISNLLKESFDFDDCNDILKRYLTGTHELEDFKSIISFLDANSSLKFSEYLKLVELFIYECKDEKGSFNEMNELCVIFLNYFKPNEETIKLGDCENLTKILSSLKKTPMFTTYVVKMYFESCANARDVNDILILFKRTGRKDISEILLKSIPNRLLGVEGVFYLINDLIGIHGFTPSVTTNMAFKSLGRFPRSQDFFFNLLEQAKMTSDEAVEIVLSFVNDRLFEMFDSRFRAILLKEIKLNHQCHKILKFQNKLRDEDIKEIGKFEIYEALNDYLVGGKIDESIDNDLKLLFDSILLPEYFHIFLRAFADFLKNDAGEEFIFSDLLAVFLSSDILTMRPMNFEMVEKLFYQLINSEENENLVLALYNLREIFLKNEIKLVFIKYFIDNKHMIENIGLGNIKQQGASDENKVVETKAIATDGNSDIDQQNNIIGTNDLQEQHNINLNSSEIDNSSNIDNENNVVQNLENDDALIYNKKKSDFKNNSQQISGLKSFINKYSQRMFKLAMASDLQRLTKEIEKIPDGEIIDCIKFILTKKSINQL